MFLLVKIGVFYVEDENGYFHQQVKIIRPYISEYMIWNSSQKTWIGSDVQTYLNSGLYWESLPTTAKEMISNTKYYIAKLDYISSNYSASTWYYNERTLESYTDSQPYSIDKFALLYPSDYLYTFAKGVDDACYNNSYSCSIPSSSNTTYNAKKSWIYNSNTLLLGSMTNDSSTWFMNPRTIYGDYYLPYLTSNGNITDTYLSSYSYKGIRPVAYLKPGVYWVSGDGSEINPYKIQISKYNITTDNNLFTAPNQGISGDRYYIEHSDIYEIDSFKLNDVLVTGDSFVMPEEDATITDIVYHHVIYNITSEEAGITYPNRMYIGEDVIIESSSEEYEVLSFKVNGELVIGTTFVMPEEDVVISDVQFKPLYYNITNNDSDINVPARAKVGSSVKLTSDNYIITSFEVNGIEVTGDTFVMPEEDVVITNIAKYECYVVESAHNPYKNDENYTVYFERTFEGASSVTVELTYQTESDSYDWVYLYRDSSTIYGGKYGGSSLTTTTVTIPTNYVKVVYRTDSSVNNYYGFKAVITPNY